MSTRGTAAAREMVLRRPALLYERLHRDGPLQWNEKASCWLVVGFELARVVLRDTRYRMPRPATDSRWMRDPELSGFVLGMMLETEGADHERLRRILGPVFGPRAVRARARRTEAMMDGLLDAVEAGRSRFDAVEAISGRLPVDVVGDLVGIPAAERDEISALCRRISRGGGLADSVPDADAVAASVAGVRELRDRIRTWPVGDEESVPGTGDSVLGRTARFREGPDALTEPQVVATVFSLYLAGHDTSRNLLSALLHRLADEDGLFDAVATGRANRSALVDEVLRTEAPLTFTVRVSDEDTELAGRVIRAGTPLRVMLGAANHDPLHDAGLTGPPGGLAFGEGRHVCLGAHVARMEGVVMLDVLARRLSRIRSGGAARWSPHFLHRGLVELPLEVVWRR
ncbi:cytochrome P450 [Actinoalloteichus hoggarensis]|uniref:Biotin biosynthesis cytochrome P450 n=1 Tax=Actinoalloteichus hoggarensis TaxID=1470176 RepID=A0A221W4V1_9PSEU|nr:cytochrome P450 [Actinoalloteichus hoggarensis]ASO20681.1 Biotin biosynthesis cytochrome P450 [Actinoalloteichus hoggarensis]MBB5924466.1 cytochrome P450 [Actinoalloteichus hoggarensis]